MIVSDAVYTVSIIYTHIILLLLLVNSTGSTVEILLQVCYLAFLLAYSFFIVIELRPIVSPPCNSTNPSSFDNSTNTTTFHNSINSQGCDNSTNSTNSMYDNSSMYMGTCSGFHSCCIFDNMSCMEIFTYAYALHSFIDKLRQVGQIVVRLFRLTN